MHKAHIVFSDFIRRQWGLFMQMSVAFPASLSGMEVLGMA